MIVLRYSQGENDYATKPAADHEPDVITGALKVIADQLGVHVKSVSYLLEYGWRQTLQDCFAGPRAKAVNDGESDDTIQAVIDAAITKRLEALLKGELALAESGGRDPIRSTARNMIKNKLIEKRQAVPSETSAEGRVWWKDMIDELLAKNLAGVKAEMKARKTSKVADVKVKLDDLFKSEE